jgi:tRNA uridine 5-carboxymethylaminomethyl modification enzyme
VREQVEIQVKYQGYIDRQLQEIERSSKLEMSRIPEKFDYSALPGLTAEVREKLIRFRPDTLGQASRIQGVTPVAISILAVAIKAGKGK